MLMKNNEKTVYTKQNEDAPHTQPYLSLRGQGDVQEIESELHKYKL